MKGEQVRIKVWSKTGFRYDDVLIGKIRDLSIIGGKLTVYVEQGPFVDADCLQQKSEVRAEVA